MLGGRALRVKEKMLYQEKIDYLFKKYNDQLNNTLSKASKSKLESPILELEIVFLFYFMFDYIMQMKKVSNLIFPELRKRVNKEVFDRFKDKIDDKTIDDIIMWRTSTYLEIINQKKKWGDAFKDICNYLTNAIPFELKKSKIYHGDFVTCTAITDMNADPYLVSQLRLVFSCEMRMDLDLCIEMCYEFNEEEYFRPLVSFTNSESERKYYAEGLKYCKCCKNFVKPTFHNLCPICEEEIK